MHGDQLGAATGQLHVQLGEADVVAGGQSDVHPVDPDDHRLESRCDRMGFGEPERIVKVDLVVVGVDTRAGRDQGVGHPAVVGWDEHAGDDDDARPLGNGPHT